MIKLKTRKKYNILFHIFAAFIALSILPKHFECINSKLFNGQDNLNQAEQLYYDMDPASEYALDIGIKLKREFADDLVSDLFATSYGLEKVARVSELDNDKSIFHFKFPRRIHNSNYDGVESDVENEHPRHRFRRHVENKIDRLRQDDRVEHVFPQIYLARHKRSLKKHKQSDNDDEVDVLSDWLDQLSKELDNSDSRKERENRKKLVNDLLLVEDFRKKSEPARANGEHLIVPDLINFNDRYFEKQWYLINEGQLATPAFHDLNVMNAWMNGYTGKNVTIVIIDDGLDHEHPDFFGKYRMDLSYDFNDENDANHDPMPSTFDEQNNHGTRCAGAAAANANNSVCGVGVAFDAQIGGIRILDGPITDLLEARALSYKATHVDIRSASWGPKDDGAHMEYPGPLVNLALETGVKHGRNGKGTLFVWASGNGGGNDDDCSCDGYVSHWNIISIGSINHRGLKPYFMELCPSTMAVVYSGGQSQVNGDEDDPGVRVVASDVRGKCTTKFQGTSSAAPLAAGALALVLEANPDLTYRDIMHLIAKTSRIPNVEDKEGWFVNGANYHVNERYGFGVLDVARMIQEAQGWKNVNERQKCVVEYEGELPELKPNSLVEISLQVDGCEKIDALEHVVSNISFVYSNRGEMKMTLISPHNTPSEILSFRRNDASKKAIENFPFMTLFNWGESPRGKWRLNIETKPSTQASGKIEHFSLVFYGSKQDDDKEYSAETDVGRRHSRSMEKKAFVPSEKDLNRMYAYEMKSSRETRIVNKRLIDKNPDLRDILKAFDNNKDEGVIRKKEEKKLLDEQLASLLDLN